MVYIYKKVIHGKPYYYLRISKRIKGKVIVKDIAYLGSDVSKIEGKLDKLPSMYKEDIKKTYRNIKKFIESEYYLKKVKKLKENPYLDNKLLYELEAIKLHFNEKFLKLDEKTKEEVFKNFVIDFAFNTTSLEGNTITLEETNKLLVENLSPKNKSLREIYDLKNTEKVFFEILNSKKKISNDFIIKIHDDLLENIDLRKNYRTGDVRVFRGGFKASFGIYVRKDMGELLEWLEKNKGIDVFILAGMFHQKFEKIHPFYGGNGRTGRMLMNYMLMRKGYPPLIVRKIRRGDYLDVLKEGNKADISDIDIKYYKKLINYLAEEMIDGYWNNFLI
ncbi:hypothetical protein CL618_01325 [archaeon]|nr:hypothetical protein [archaeon]|tara:strand:+ start:20 stop:1018 length:999 start_codon:yes stop_codon:yes gene_type:complete